MGCCQGGRPGEGELAVVSASPVVAQRGTPFGQFLEAGHMAVVRATYFKDCLQRGEPFQDRGNLPAEAIIDGKEVVDLWVEFGYAFLVVISYPWLAKGHPDPHCFHLPKLVQALEIFKQYHDGVSWKGEKRDRILELEGGIILDFCSFWQGTRSPEQDRRFKEGLSLINIPYGHRDVTALKLVSTPATEARLYDDRGWTHFESTVIDGKAPSARDSWGKRNVLTVGDGFRPEVAFASLANTQRKPPLTPERFREELQARRERAEAKGERLFTSNKDSPVILSRYDASFGELCRSTQLNYFNMGWGEAAAEDLALALPYFQALEALDLGSNQLGGEAAMALAAAFPQCPKLRVLTLSRNRLGENAEASAMLMRAFGECAALEELNVAINRLQGEAVGLFVAAIPRCSALRTLDLSLNAFGEDMKAEIRSAWQAAGKQGQLTLF